MRLWSVRALWATVAALWIGICHWQGYGLDSQLLGVLFCAIFAWRGFLAGKHGVYR